MTTLADLASQVNSNIEQVSSVLSDAEGKVNSFNSALGRLAGQLQNADGSAVGTVSAIAGLTESAAQMAGLFNNDVSAAIAGVSSILGTVSSILPTVITSVRMLGTVSAFLAANPLLAVVSALGLAVVAGVALVKNWDQVKEAVRTAVNFMAGLLEQFINFYLDVYVNPVIKGINAIAGIFGQKIPEIEVELGRWGESTETVADKQGEASEEIADHLNQTTENYNVAADEATAANARITGDFRTTAEIIKDIKRAERDGLRKAEQERIAASIIANREAHEQRLAEEKKLTEDLLKQEEARAAAQEKNIEASLSRARKLAGLVPLDRLNPGVSSGVANLRRTIADSGGIETEEQAAARLRRIAESRGLSEQETLAMIAQNRAARSRLLTGIGASNALPVLPGQPDPNRLLSDERQRVSGETGVGGEGGASIISIVVEVDGQEVQAESALTAGVN